MIFRARPVHGARYEWKRAVEVLASVVVAEADGNLIGFQQWLLAGESLHQQLADNVQIQIQQRRQHTYVGDILHQDAGPGVVEVLVAHARQRHTQDVHVLSAQHVAARPGGVVEQVSAGRHFAKIPLVGLRVHGHGNIHASRARQVSAVAGANFVPGRQTLDVGGKEVLARHRNTHPEQGLHQQRIGAGGAGAVYVGDAYREIVICRHGPWRSGGRADR